MDIRFDVIQDYLPYFLQGMGLTIGLSLIGILMGSVMGLFIALGKMTRFKVIQFPFIWYINFFRGTPLFVQILLIHFGVMPIFMSPVNPIASAIVSLSLNAAAYIAEIFRAGIQSIDRGQMEAARSLGMSHVQAMRYVILPQAVKRMIPPLGNEFIVLLKDSSLAAVIAAPELMYWGRAASGATFRVWEPYLTVALIYLVLTLSLTYVLNYVERKLATE
ncbi:amino acid ABC transporter membrane protein (PAAT family) [Melghiribacillus thermohalophilus]|uniref:Amino acid ABC transporter membrane protein (PAAT family) n=1 Tax=Melghiribacillus thermohalophilus TaxID=1324956 RepID=A0A4R3MV04_9BACI|nr:amino acid ABC transporter permease [Melghiribacillus thermohalophilus]TCT20328.1 amino acid ABC transporter membrane protein (PAAT family) [Melghiribacillus thermohalophilus]